MLKSVKIGTEAKGEELRSFLNALDEACLSEEDYEAFTDVLPDR